MKKGNCKKHDYEDYEVTKTITQKNLSKYFEEGDNIQIKVIRVHRLKCKSCLKKENFC